MSTPPLAARLVAGAAVAAAIVALAWLDAVVAPGESQRDLLLSRLAREHRSAATPATGELAAASGARFTK